MITLKKKPVFFISKFFGLLLIVSMPDQAVLLCRWHSFGRHSSDVWGAQFPASSSFHYVFLLDTPNYH